ncbi:MAG TPA: DUF6596 domain-containing protein [Rhodanobacteraceae bacterium]
MTDAARQTIEQVARDSRTRLVAFLAARCHDLAAAEDALSEAFGSALVDWPRDGIPDSPEAWLLTVARRRLIDTVRHEKVCAEATPKILATLEDAQSAAHDDARTFPDERLKLLFVCAHPAIAANARTPLMLQVVLGLDAARIASAFLVKPAAMGQRLSRVKAKIRDAGIAFAVPSGKDLPARLDAVLETIYAAYGSGWDDIAGADSRRKGLAAEAIELGALLMRLLPNEAETLGLCALMLYCESRRQARRGPHGEYIPLSEQDVTRWSAPMIEQANHLLRIAERRQCIGRFQLEAAIQSEHACRVRGVNTNWESIALLYEGLVRIAPTTGARVGRAAAVARARGASSGWDLLQQIPASSVASYQPYWAVAADLLEQLHRFDEADAARVRAIGLCQDEAMRAFLAKTKPA